MQDPLWEALQTMCSMKQGTLEMLFGCGDIGGIIKKTKPSITPPIPSKGMDEAC